MTGLDTNVLVRFLTRDDPVQARRAEALIAALAAEGHGARIDVVVLCELVWVLESAYGLPRAEIASALDGLLDAAPFVIDDRDLVRQAVARYRAGRLGFSDHMIGLRNRRAGCAATATFDRKLKGNADFVLA